MDAEGLMPHNTSDINKTISMEMRMARTMNTLNMCHGNTTSQSVTAVTAAAAVASTTKSSSFVTPPEHIGPNKFTFPSIDAAVVRNIPTVNAREMKISALNSKHSVSAIAVTSNNSNSNENSTTNNNRDKADTLSHNSNYNVHHNSTNADLASVDSSDTFMSCQTHPFLSQGDLAMMLDNDDNNDLCDLDMIDADASFYINSANNMVLQQRGSSNLHSGPVNIILDSSLNAPQVKKSTSGDTALRSLATSPIEAQYQAFVADRGSRVSLNETPLPKHRKTRFQQQTTTSTTTTTTVKSARFDDERDSDEIAETTVNTATNNGSNSSSSTTTSNKKNRRASFMPSKIITTATKQLINQHLFGLQSMSSSKGGGESLFYTTIINEFQFI